jgi:PilZ domain
MQQLVVMNTPELLNESRSGAHRSSVAMPQGLTDHDPAAHHHAVEIDATVRVSGRELRAQACRLRSLSLGGALVDINRLPIGTLINITFGLPSVEDRLSLDAVVQRCTRDGVAVLFDSLRAGEVWILWRYLTSLDDDAELEPTRTLTAEHEALKP